MQTPERLLTPGEVALIFRVDPKTVTRWASAGRIGSIRTPGGHRRFRESEVNDLVAELNGSPRNPPSEQHGGIAHALPPVDDPLNNPGAVDQRCGRHCAHVLETPAGECPRVSFRP